MKLSLALFRDYALIALGAIIQALSMVLFYIPGRLAAGGVSGLAQIIHQYSGLPIGMMVLLGNLPLFVLGWRHLGGRRFVARTIFAVIVYTVSLDALAPFMPPDGITADPVLNMLYGGVIGGLGVGLVLRARGTTGGTDILARLMNRWLGIDLGQAYLLSDTAVILLAVPTFGWTLALYAVVALYVTGLGAEVASEGLNVARTATIISDKSEAVARQLLVDLGRGVTSWIAVGEYTGSPRRLLFCAISRAEVSQLKEIVRTIDPNAFVVIGQAHEVIGLGFQGVDG